MRLEYQYHWDDLLEADHYVGPPVLTQTRRWIVRIIPLAYLALFVASLYEVQKYHHRSPAPWYVNVMCFACLAAILIAVVLRSYRRMQRANWIKMGPPTVADISEQGISLNSRGGENTVAWSAFIRTAETPTGFLLIRPDNRFVMLPKRACTGARDVEQLRGVLDQHIPISKFSHPIKPETAILSGMPNPRNDRFAPDSQKEIDPVRLLAHERKAAWGLILGMAAPVAGLVLTLLLDPKGHIHANFAAVPFFALLLVGLTLYLWGCGHLAGSRGFRPAHGVVVGFAIGLGPIYLVSRAKPLPGEIVDRNSFLGLLTAPMAKNADLGSYS